MHEIYILMADTDGTISSCDEPIGVSVSSLNEANKFVKESIIGYTRSFRKTLVFETYLDAQNAWSNK